MPQITARVNFYGDSREYKNKFFSFKVCNQIEARKCLNRFEKDGVYIRAAFYTIKDGDLIKFSSRIK